MPPDEVVANSFVLMASFEKGLSVRQASFFKSRAFDFIEEANASNCEFHLLDVSCISLPASPRRREPT
jgi:hypothetical protein